jgi:8-oxo-dGTP pyrophosphatase MutT (NUDIX family)
MDDDPGKWCLICGYIDWNESLHQAVAREVFEEVGLDVDDNNCIFYDVGDAPHHNRQNITFHFVVDLGASKAEIEEKINYDEDEVADVMFIHRHELQKEELPVEFAFNHGKRLQRIARMGDDIQPMREVTLDVSKTTQFK